MTSTINFLNRLPPWTFIAVYVVLIYPWYRVFLWANLTDFWTRPKKACTKGEHRNAILMAVSWYFPVALMLLVGVMFVVTASFVWLSEKYEKRPPFRWFAAIDRWFKDETPCK